MNIEISFSFLHSLETFSDKIMYLVSCKFIPVIFAFSWNILSERIENTRLVE